MEIIWGIKACWTTEIGAAGAYHRTHGVYLAEIYGCRGWSMVVAVTVGVLKRDWCRSEFYGLWMFMVEISNWFSWDESNFRTGKAPPRMFIRFVQNHEPWWKKSDSTSKIKHFIYLENHNLIFFVKRPWPFRFPLRLWSSGATCVRVARVFTAVFKKKYRNNTVLLRVGLCESCYGCTCGKNTVLLRVGLQYFFWPFWCHMFSLSWPNIRDKPTIPRHLLQHFILFRID